MSSDALDLVRSFRGNVGGPGEDVAARVFDRVRDSSQPTPPRLARPRLLPVAAPLVVAVAAAVAVVLAAPWQRGPASVPAAEAARVLNGALAALAPRAGWVFHERVQLDEVVPGTTARRIGLRELWIVNGPPSRFRQITTNVGFGGTIETGGTAGSPRGYVFDAKTRTIYRSQLDGRLLVPAQLASASWRLSIQRDVRAKQARVLGRTVIDGRSAYEIEWFLAQSPLKLYVDAATYAPITLEFPGLSYLDGHWWVASEHFTAYGYAQPTKDNLALTNIVALHPSARLARASEIPRALRTKLNPISHAPNGR